MSTTRREFLKRLGSGAVALVGVQFLSGCEELTFESKIPGAPPTFLTPAADGSWYWQSGAGTSKDDAPSIAPDDWELAVRDDDGLIDTLGFSDLEQYAQQGDALTYWKTMRCVFGADWGPGSASLVANGIFTGIPLYRVLEDLGVSDQAAKLRTFGADGFRSNLDMARALEQGPEPLPILLAYELNGAPISRLRGGPVRLVAPEMWGYKNVKWLEQLTATQSDAFFGTYETERFNPELDGVSEADQRRIDAPGEIALGSVITDPAAVSTEIEGPDVTIAGTSFAGAQRIDKVELSLNDGAFEEAEIIGEDEALEDLDDELRAIADQSAQAGQPWPWAGVWVTWRKTFSGLSAGSYTVTVRANDESGRSQPADPSQSGGNPPVTAPQVTLPFRVT